MTTVVAADLDFTLEREGESPVHGRITGADNRLVLSVDDASAFAGGQDAAVIRGFARALAVRGMSVRVEQDGQTLVTLGAVRAPWWQRPFTRSRRVRVGSVRGAWTSVRSRTRVTEPALPSSGLLPPTTLWPLAPTLGPRAGISTTHDPDRGGAARLVLLREEYQPGEHESVWWLTDGTTIGSGADCDVRLPGLADVQAVVHHDEDDEWIVEAVGGETRVHGAVIATQLLRTGARITLGRHGLGFYREEYADHGRPHGGRVGGEFGLQVPQAPRPHNPGERRDS